MIIVITTSIRSQALNRGISPKVGKKLFLFGTLLFWMGLYVYVPILSPYTESLSNSLFLVGLVGGSYGFTQFLFRFPLGLWSDRAGLRKPFVLSGYVLLFISCIGLALSPNAWILLLFRGLTGVAASMWVAFTVLYASYFREDQTARAMSHTTFCLGFGQMLSSVGGKIANSYGRIATFYVGAGLAILGMVFMLPASEKVSKSQTSRSLRSLLAVAARRRLLVVSIITSLSQFAIFMTTVTFLPIYARDIGASDTGLGVLTLIINSCQTLAMLLTGTVVVPRIGHRAAVGVAYASIACATFATPGIQSFRLLLLVQGLGALGRGLAYPVLMGMAIQGVPKEEKATAMGFFQAVYAIGMFSGPAVGGFLAARIGLYSIFFCAGTVYVLACIMGIFTLPGREKA